MVAVRSGLRQLGPLRVWQLGLDATVRLYLGLVRTMGLSALYHWLLEFLCRLWLGLGAGLWQPMVVQGRMGLERGEQPGPL
jgi:hypothetical protein